MFQYLQRFFRRYQYTPKHLRFKKWIIIILYTCYGCTPSVPHSIQPIPHFKVDKYMGTWYEIGRLDNRFEKNLNQVKAHYTKKNNSIRIDNSGLPIKGGKRKTKIGRAVWADKPHVGHLKVSFFWPFYSSYVIFYIENDYSVALVCGDTRAYCWILSRTPIMDIEKRRKYISILKENGFDTKKLIFPEPYQEVSDILSK